MNIGESTPMMSLKKITSQPSQFTPFAYEFKPTDFSILERSLAQREARQQAASQARQELDKTLGAIQGQMNEAEREYFEAYKDNIEKDVNASIDIMDWGNAIKKATLYGGNILKDVNIIDRIKAQSEYSKRIEEEKNRIGKGVSSAKFDWWANKNQYKFIADESGKGGKLGDMGVLYDDIDYASWALAASQLYKPDKTSSASSGNNEERHWSSSSSLQQVTPENIKEVTEKLFIARPEAREQFVQDFEFRRDQYLNRLQNYQNDPSLSNKESLDQVQKGIIKNGVIMPMEEFFQQQILLYAKPLSYTESSNSSGGGAYAVGGSGSGGGKLITPDMVPKGFGDNYIVPAPQVMWSPVHQASPISTASNWSSYADNAINKSITPKQTTSKQGNK